MSDDFVLLNVFPSLMAHHGEVADLMKSCDLFPLNRALWVVKHGELAHLMTFYGLVLSGVARWETIAELFQWRMSYGLVLSNVVPWVTNGEAGRLMTSY